MNVEGIVWMGVRTSAFGELRALLADVMGLETTHEADGVAWFALPGGEEIQIYDDGDAHHTFFGDGPVVGFQVADFEQATAELVEAGIEMVGEGDSDGLRRWRHFRGPDGNVYEVIGPA